MSLASLLYRHSPRFLQDLACTAYGARQRAIMYGGNFRALFDRLVENETADPDKLERLQLQQMDWLLRHAVEHVPYYRERRQVYDRQVSCWEEYRQLTILEKETLRSNAAEFVVDRLPRTGVLTSRTSGTTGTPLVLRAPYEQFRLSWAAQERMRRWAGVSRHDRRASFIGKTIVPGFQKQNGVSWRFDWASRRMLMSVFHLDDSTLPSYVHALRRFRPKMIDGYPSAIARVARYLIDHPDQRPDCVVALLPTAETLTPELRETMEAGFRARVHNQYGCTELCLHAAECEHGTLHVSPEVGIVEIVDDHGRPVADGEMGHVVATGLAGTLMPLIRYRIGDMAVAAPRGFVCPCGRTLPSLAAIVGRNEDLVRAADGRSLPIMNDHIFKWARGVREAQLVQEDFDRFAFVVVPENGSPPDLSRSVRELEARIGYPIQTRVQCVASIPRTGAGKFRGVVSMVSGSVTSKM